MVWVLLLFSVLLDTVLLEFVFLLLWVDLKMLSAKVVEVLVH